MFEGKPGIGAVKPATGKGGWMEASTVGDRKRKRNILMWRGLAGNWARNRRSSAFIGTWLGLVSATAASKAANRRIQFG